MHDAPHLDWAAQTASALCIAARWLSAASLAFTFCAFALALAGVRASLIVALILVLGLGQLYLAFRIEFDAGIFAGAAMRPGSWREFGAVLKSPTKGFPILSPYWTIANNAMRQMLAFLTEFGMTPASRTRIETGEPPVAPRSMTGTHGKNASRFFD